MALATAMNILRVGILVFFDKKEGGGNDICGFKRRKINHSILFYSTQVIKFHESQRNSWDIFERNSFFTSFIQKKKFYKTKKI